MSDDLRDLLRRAGELAGIDTDLGEIFDRARQNETETRETRDSLPTRKLKKAFDRELRRQEVTAQDRARVRAEKYRRTNARRLKILERTLRTNGNDNPYPRLVPADLWIMVKRIKADRSGWAAQYYAKSCPHKIAVTMCHRAALSYVNGKPRYSYAGESRGSIRARAIFAIGLLLVHMSKPTRRHGQGWNRVVKGIPQDVFTAALADPNDPRRKPHPNTVNGRHRVSPKETTDGRVGYLNALKAAGLFYSWQCHWREGEDPRSKKGWADILPEEIPSTIPNSSGWRVSLARYWVVSNQFTDAKSAEKRARLWVAWLAGCLPWGKDEEGNPVPEIDYKPVPKSASPPS